MLAVATSAVRDATNRDEFIARVAASGFEPRLLSGEEEAATTFAGVCSRAPGGAAVSADGTLIIDVGGGSTEIVLGAEGGVAWSRSLQAGCVRMTERMLGEDVAAGADLAACALAVSELLEESHPTASSRRRGEPVAVAGTATTIAAVLHRKLRGRRRARRPHLARRHAGAPRATPGGDATRAARREVPGLQSERAPVIVAGLVVLGAVLDRFGLAEAIVSERDIMHGAALLAAGSTSRAEIVVCT